MIKLREVRKRLQKKNLCGQRVEGNRTVPKKEKDNAKENDTDNEKGEKH